MSEAELAKILGDMCKKAEKDDKNAQIVLFGIEYADEINIGKSKKWLSVNGIVEKSGIRKQGSKSYVKEVNVGIRLAKYVSLK